jgi:hypothetical protein
LLMATCGLRVTTWYMVYLLDPPGGGQNKVPWVWFGSGRNQKAESKWESLSQRPLYPPATRDPRQKTPDFFIF